MVSATTPASRSRSRPHAGTRIDAAAASSVSKCRSADVPRACFPLMWIAPRRQLIQAHGNGLAQVHRGLARIGGNLHQHVAESEILAGESALLRSEDKRHAAAAGELGVDMRRQLRKRNHRSARACDARAFPCPRPVCTRPQPPQGVPRALRFGAGLTRRRRTSPRASVPRKARPRRGAEKPKLAMARAAAPILRGLRGETSTNSTRSRWAFGEQTPILEAAVIA